MVPDFTRHQPSGQQIETFDLLQAQGAVDQWIDQLKADVPILDGRLIEDVELSAYVANDIEHGLSRELRGWYVVKDPVSRAHFHVTLGSSQAVGTSSWTRVRFDTEVYDDGSNYDNATDYVFTAPHKGLYTFSAGAGFASHANRNIIRISTSQEDFKGVQQSDPANAHSRNVVVSVAVVRLDKGDTADVDVWQDTGGNLNVLGNAIDTYFCGRSIEYLKDGQDDSDHPGVDKFLRLYSSRDRTVSLWVF